MLRCCITDRGVGAVGDLLREGAVDWIQIRDKELGARALLDVVRQVMEMPNPHAAKILVNSRIDIAIAAGAAGAHLPSGSVAPSEWRAITPPEFLIGVSCHSLDEVRQAEREGADYVVFGPVFSPRSKITDLAPRGLDELRRVSRSVKIPVLALGGITRENARSCVDAGAAGVAGISMFQR